MAQRYLDNKEHHNKKSKAWYQANKSIVSIKGKAARASNRESINLKRRLKKYGITLEQYNQKLVENNNSCEICKKPFTETPAIDHDHTTGQFRSLLCDNDNTALGLMKENLATLESSMSYLKKYKK
jgi:hypothetical protein